MELFRIQSPYSSSMSQPSSPQPYYQQNVAGIVYPTVQTLSTRKTPALTPTDVVEYPATYHQHNPAVQGVPGSQTSAVSQSQTPGQDSNGQPRRWRTLIRICFGLFGDRTHHCGISIILWFTFSSYLFSSQCFLVEGVRCCRIFFSFIGRK